MTVGELVAALAQADPDAEVFAQGADAAAFRVDAAAVWMADDFAYTGMPGMPGDVVVQMAEAS